MRTFDKQRWIEAGAVALALVGLSATPAWATVALPSPAAGGLVGAAIVGAIVVAKLWRRK